MSAAYLTDCGVAECQGSGWFAIDDDRVPVECGACGEYATIRQMQYLVHSGFVVYLNLATTRFEVHRRVGTGTEIHGESYGSVLEAIADLVLGVDLPPSTVAPHDDDGRETETAPTQTVPGDPSGTRATTNPVRPSSTPPVTPNAADVALGQGCPVCHKPTPDHEPGCTVAYAAVGDIAALERQVNRGRS